ncbi:hypothetical protein E2562_008550 [Oryza meyeriana var. granulata]|uniref:Uncharacterized protein n=1 Tax=Oryza meyeriana var. granulata TaxID=110450 RepID=A0A6G1C4V8_9ORYZ|nr:hypothetical protein E2562_008550 [Oryza meyeriana var. granulata]
MGATSGPPVVSLPNAGAVALGAPASARGTAGDGLGLAAELAAGLPAALALNQHLHSEKKGEINKIRNLSNKKTTSGKVARIAYFARGAVNVHSTNSSAPPRHGLSSPILRSLLFFFLSAAGRRRAWCRALLGARRCRPLCRAPWAARGLGRGCWRCPPSLGGLGD